MTDRTDHADELARSWEANAELWVRAVRGNRIASRAAATDSAILTAIAAHRPHWVLDIGCGEGWLVRRLVREAGCRAVGIDGSTALVDAARAADPEGDYRKISFEAFVADADLAGGPYDVAVFNYALFDGIAADLLATAASRLVPGGVVIVQTLHPWIDAGASYHDGWRVEDFGGFAEPGESWTPMPWYFRTLGSWMALIRDAGLALEDLAEPGSDRGEPLSMLLTAGRTA